MALAAFAFGADGAFAEVAAPRGDKLIAAALVKLGDLHAEGEIGAANGKAALSYYRKLVQRTPDGDVLTVISPEDLVEVTPSAPADAAAAEEAYDLAAEIGSAEAFVRLGNLYRDGTVVPPDPAKAFAYFSKAAELGSTTGQVAMGLMMIRGEGTDRDVAGGLATLEKSADAGSTEALLALGRLFADGEEGSVEADAARAFPYFLSAADAGNPTGLVEAGRRLLSGDGIKVSPSRGLAMLTEAGETGNPDALLTLGDLYESGNVEGVPVDPALAFDYYRRAADAGSQTAKVQMASMLIDGRGTSRNLNEAQALLEAAADAGSTSALMMLGDLYSGVMASVVLPVQPGRAFDYYTRAADAGNTSAKLRVGEMLLSGEGVPADRSRGRALIEEVARSGDPAAYLMLADLYDGGTLGFDRDPGKAFDYYRRAADVGSGTGQMEAAERMIDGRGTAQDVEGGMSLLRTAVESGNSAALLTLGDVHADGRAGAVDAAAAIEAYEKAGAAGVTDAFLRLGDLYRDGRILPSDGERAVYFYERAAGIAD